MKRQRKYIGNLPIYEKNHSNKFTGSYVPMGCLFVINSYVESNICVLQFSLQNNPTLQSFNNFEVHMDLASLLRLKHFLYIGLDSDRSINGHLHVTSTKINQKLNEQNAAYVSIDDNILKIIIDNSSQTEFKIKSPYQINVFAELINTIIDILKMNMYSNQISNKIDISAPALKSHNVSSNVPSPVSGGTIIT